MSYRAEMLSTNLPSSADRNAPRINTAYLFFPTVLQWKRPPYSPMDNDTFSYQDGKIKVGKRGRYYIYSQVAFCTKPETHASFSLYVYLNLPSEADQLLLKGVGTHGTSDDLCSLQSIHVGRVVELQEGHVIFVNVTDLSRVNYDHGYTYFGMSELS